MVFVNERIDPHDLPKSPLLYGQFFSLDSQDDYDIYGTFLAWGSGHYWILIGEDDFKLVAVKTTRNKLPAIQHYVHFGIHVLIFAITILGCHLFAGCFVHVHGPPS